MQKYGVDGHLFEKQFHESGKPQVAFDAKSLLRKQRVMQLSFTRVYRSQFYFRSANLKVFVVASGIQLSKVIQMYNLTVHKCKAVISRL